ncbi:hypothetical protein [Aestuariicoccus sp. MJ-SS9]|uniref:hypothetical protein n=1 Tax=Aestuariicoccus sp. MJ-SS9 TaxID=3079855 RepID=UPI00290C547B|nr:hypothetical protein [Aestuariicoccus sp. MJ-SS9]MDU8911838.1 hypothetical protein [Aestuariicoccus sp. MJ-SS9]
MDMFYTLARSFMIASRNDSRTILEDAQWLDDARRRRSSPVQTDAMRRQRDD